MAGTATQVGAAFAGTLRRFAVLSRGVPMVALRNGTELARFHSATPGTILGTVTVTGLQPQETLVGIDLRPADGQLYGVGSTSRLYLLNPITGAATPIGPVFPTVLSGTSFGVDFNPLVDRLRIVSDAEQNLRHQPEQRCHRRCRHGAQSGGDGHGGRLSQRPSTAPGRPCSTTSMRLPTSC